MKQVLVIMKHHLNVVFKKKLSVLMLIMPILPIFLGGLVMQSTEVESLGTVYMTAKTEGEVVDALEQRIDAEDIKVMRIDEREFKEKLEVGKQGIYIEIDTDDLFSSLKLDQDVIGIYQVGEYVTDQIILQKLDTVIRSYAQVVNEVKDEVDFLRRLGEDTAERITIEVSQQERDINEGMKSTLGIFILLFLLVCGKNLDILIKEKQNNVYTRIKTMPITQESYLLGHVCGALSIMAMQSVIIYIGLMILKINLGIPSGYVILLCLVLGIVGIAISLLIYQFTKTADSYFIGSTITMTILSFMGGGLFPDSILPEGMKTLALISPVTWVVKAYDQFAMTGEGIVFIQYSAIALLISSVIMAVAIYKEYSYKRL